MTNLYRCAHCNDPYPWSALFDHDGDYWCEECLLWEEGLLDKSAAEDDIYHAAKEEGRIK